MSKLEKLAIDGALWVATWSPGDGKTRYRFFNEAQNSFFGPKNGIYTGLGYREAETFATGFRYGLGAAKRGDG